VTIYSYGGQTPGIGYSNGLYALDTNTVTWRNIHVSGQKPPPVRHCGLCSTDGKLYMFGGYGPPLKQEHIQEGGNWVEIGDGNGINNVFYAFDLNKGEWNCVVDNCENRPEPRNGHTLTAVGPTIVLFGGRGCNGSKLSDIHLYNVRTQRWSHTKLSDVWPQPRCFHTACLIHSDNILVLGGIGNDSRPCNDDAYLFDMELLRWYKVSISYYFTYGVL
jgi:N-acetylneuraminic acid mutarotase